MNDDTAGCLTRLVDGIDDMGEGVGLIIDKGLIYAY